MKKFGIILITIAIILSEVVMPVVTAAPAFHKVVGGGTSISQYTGYKSSIAISASQIDEQNNAKGQITGLTHTPSGELRITKFDVIALVVDDNTNKAWIACEITSNPGNPSMVGMGFLLIVQDGSLEQYMTILWDTPQEAKENALAKIEFPYYTHTLTEGNINII